MNLFLFLTAMLSALTGVGRVVETRAQSAIAASSVVALADVVAAVGQRVAPSRPDGYVATSPLMLDLRRALDIVRPVTPERRRE